MGALPLYIALPSAPCLSRYITDDIDRFHSMASMEKELQWEKKFQEGCGDLYTYLLNNAKAIGFLFHYLYPTLRQDVFCPSSMHATHIVTPKWPFPPPQPI